MKDALSVGAGLFFMSYKPADSFASSGMSLAFDQKQHGTPDQSVHTRGRAALCGDKGTIISGTSIRT